MKIYKMDPLDLLLKSHGFNPENIAKIVTGLKYTAVLAKSGNIGVCANLGNKLETEINASFYHKTNDLTRRIMLNAYFNAILNYTEPDLASGDIFEFTDFQKYGNIVMIGLFKPIVKKFAEHDIPLQVFDLRFGDKIERRRDLKEIALRKADSVILTATSIFNRSFIKLISFTKENCDIYILGPSSPMTRQIFQYRNVKAIFGARFCRNDERVLNMIENDGGTRDFLKFGEKCILEFR